MCEVTMDFLFKYDSPVSQLTASTEMKHGNYCITDVVLLQWLFIQFFKGYLV
jgi:hypothetical protein